MKLFRISHYLRTSLWVVPVLCVGTGVILSVATLAVDDGDLVPRTLTGGPDAALVILGSVAASMVTLTGLVLTIVLVVVQLAMGQFSPRIVRAILRDRPSQLAIGVFAGTFAYAMIAMKDIASTEPKAPIPGLAIVVTFVLVVVSIAVLILYVHHIGQSLRVADLIESVGQETRAVLDRVYQDHGAEPELEDRDLIRAPSSGVLFHIDDGALVEQARAADCRLIMVPAIGDFVPAGAPLFRVLGHLDRLDGAAATRSVALGPERTMNEDPAYGFRMLVDIAVRSLSDPLDPTTAVQAIDRLHDLLRHLVQRPIPSGEHHDDHGQLRLLTPTMDWNGYVLLSFEEIRDYAPGHVQVVRRLQAALEDLRSIAPSERQPPLDRQLGLLDGAHQQRVEGHPEAAVPIVADPQGIGSASELQTQVGPPAQR